MCVSCPWWTINLVSPASFWPQVGLVRHSAGRSHCSSLSPLVTSSLRKITSPWGRRPWEITNPTINAHLTDWKVAYWCCFPMHLLWEVNGRQVRAVAPVMRFDLRGGTYPLGEQWHEDLDRLRLASAPGARVACATIECPECEYLYLTYREVLGEKGDHRIWNCWSTSTKSSLVLSLYVVFLTSRLSFGDMIRYHLQAF